MASETLREYLVKLGWDVNKSGFDNASGLVDKFAAKLMSKAGAMGTAFLTASSTMIKASLVTAEAISEIAFSAAEADTSVERLARKYWISEQSARSLANAQEQLGISVEDLMYATNEEYERFLELNEFGKTLEAPAALDDTLVKIRDIQFEFAKTRSILSYGLRWLTYYLGQYLGVDIEQIRSKLVSMNTWLATNLPKIADKLAKILSIGWRLAKTVLTLIYNLGKGILQVVERLGTTGVASILALAAAFKAAAMGPIGWILMALGAIVLLLEDFMVWKQGGKSLFDWSGIEEPINSLWESLLDIASAVGDLFSGVKNLFSYLGSNTNVLSTVNDLLKAAADFIGLIATGITDISALLNPGDEGLQEKAGKKTATFIEKFGNFAAPIVDFFGGNGENVKKGAKAFSDMVYFGSTKEQITGSASGTNSGFLWTPDSGVSPWNTQNTTTNINTGNIIVNTKTNASANDIGTSVADSIKRIQSTSSPNTRMGR